MLLRLTRQPVLREWVPRPLIRVCRRRTQQTEPDLRKVGAPGLNALTKARIVGHPDLLRRLQMSVSVVGNKCGHARLAAQASCVIPRARADLRAVRIGQLARYGVAERAKNPTNAMPLSEDVARASSSPAYGASNARPSRLAASSSH